MPTPDCAAAILLTAYKKWTKYISEKCAQGTYVHVTREKVSRVKFYDVLTAV